MISHLPKKFMLMAGGVEVHGEADGPLTAGVFGVAAAATGSG